MATIDTGSIAQIILALATLVTAMGGVIIGIINSAKIERSDKKIDQVHEQGNSNLQQMRTMATALGMAEGNLTGRSEQTAERRLDEAGVRTMAPAMIVAAPIPIPTPVVIAASPAAVVAVAAPAATNTDLTKASEELVKKAEDVVQAVTEAKGKAEATVAAASTLGKE